MTAGAAVVFLAAVAVSAVGSFLLGTLWLWPLAACFVFSVGIAAGVLTAYMIDGARRPNRKGRP